MNGRARERVQRVDFVFRDGIERELIYFSLSKNHIRGFFLSGNYPFVGHVFFEVSDGKNS